MADCLSMRPTNMLKDCSHVSDSQSDICDTTSQGNRDDLLEQEPGYVEDRFRVDRKKLEQMLQDENHPALRRHLDSDEEGAEEFFQRVMDETNTQITWPSKLKIGAKSKKDPHIKVIGMPEDVKTAKDRIMAVLDTKSNRVTLKMDVSHTDHSHVIGKGGNNIKRVMKETGCHIHFPDSNRGSSVQEKSNQVSIAGQPEGVEDARVQIRQLLPLVFMFELPVTGILQPLPDVSSPAIQQLQQQYNVTISFRQRPRMYVTTVIVRGSVCYAKMVKEGTGRLMEHLTGNVGATLPVSMQLEIAQQHHLFIIGRGGMNIKQIMQQTGSSIHFPDPTNVTPQRKGTVYITGSIESVFQARQHLIGCLPLVLMFDVKDEIEMDQIRITQLMEQLDVFISVKPKPKQPSKSVIVKSIERNATNMYLARLMLLGYERDIKKFPLPASGYGISSDEQNMSTNNSLGLTALGFFGQNMLSVNTGNVLGVNTGNVLGMNTANSLLMMNGHRSPSVGSPHNSPCSNSPNHWVPPPPGIYGPVMVVNPANTCSVQNQLDLLTQCNGMQKDHGPNSAFMRVPTSIDTGVCCNVSETNSPSRSPCSSPVCLGKSQSAVDLRMLQQPEDCFSKMVTRETSPSGSGHTLDLLGLSKMAPLYKSQSVCLDGSMGGRSLESSLTHATLENSLGGRRVDGSLSQRALENSLSRAGLEGSLSRVSLENSLSRVSLENSLSRITLQNGDNVTDSDLVGLSGSLAPGIERKNSGSSLFPDDQYPFAVDYEQKKLLATKAIQKKPSGESRIPTDFWSGMGFSKSTPESAIREMLAQSGVRYVEPSMSTTYENAAGELSAEMDGDPWRDFSTPANKPINPAPGEYPSPRKKYEYSLSNSNHVDSASLPARTTQWSQKTDLAELFSKMGLGKYTDLFQQQEIDLATFLTLTDHDLRELGISTFGARRKMLLAIADLNKRMTLMNANSNNNPFQQSGASGMSVNRHRPDIASLSGRW